MLSNVSLSLVGYSDSAKKILCHFEEVRCESCRERDTPFYLRLHRIKREIPERFCPVHEKEEVSRVEIEQWNEYIEHLYETKGYSRDCPYIRRALNGIKTRVQFGEVDPILLLASAFKRAAEKGLA